MTSLWKEPLVHFVLAALALFALNGLWQSNANRQAETIFVSESDLERMAALYAAETGKLPPPEDMQSMLADHVRQAVLVREARKLGLEQDDTVIDRRLAQKMEFMIADLAEDISPSEADLEAWYRAHEDRFREPPRITFKHVFFSANSSKTAGRDFAEILSKLNQTTPSDWSRMGDPFMLQRQYGALPYRETVRIFGREFAAAVFSVENVDGWQGPVKSALGQHIVHIENRTESVLPRLEDIRETVTEDWQSERRRAGNAEAIADLINAYEIEIEGITE